MSGLILCRTKESKIPYYIANMDLKIYSLEELCYYIYNNIYLISIDVADAKLTEFIRNEIQEAPLADKLEYLMQQKAGLAEIVITILKYVDYYTPKEIEDIREILANLNTQNVLERLKARADTYLENKCYFSAIKNYCRIKNAEKDSTLPGIFYAGVFHNMGIAYANLYLFKQASEYFEEAYAIGQHEESKKCAMSAMILTKGSDSDILSQTEKELSEEEYVLKREIETLMDNAVFSREYKEFEAIRELKHEGMVAEYYRSLEELLDTWKKQYGKYTT